MDRRQLLGLILLPVVPGLAAAAGPAAAAPRPVPRPAIEIGDSPVLGPADAPVTIAVFGDFACRECARGSRVLARLLEEDPVRVRVVFKHFPAGTGPDDILAHRAAVAAGEQGKFWRMHRLLFAFQPNFSRADLVEYAEVLALDVDRFTESLDSDRVRTRVLADIAQGRRLGIPAAPAYVVNGRVALGSRDLRGFQDLVDLAARPVPPSPAGGARKEQPWAR